MPGSPASRACTTWYSSGLTSFTRNDAGNASGETFLMMSESWPNSSWARSYAASLDSYATVSTCGRSLRIPLSRSCWSGPMPSVRYTTTSTRPVVLLTTRSTSRRISRAMPRRKRAMNAVEIAANTTSPLRRRPITVSRKK